MEQFDLYRDIAARTGGDVYIGVVGPVRTGKSTFIKNFMQTLILSRIEDENRRMRVTDELPQSGDGKTIMTTQPKFVPESSVRVDLQEGAGVNVRLIDCVGYPVEDAMGYTEGERTRLVTTPWSEEEMTFEQAAELGTRKVICDHSTIGVIITTDGSITGIDRESYRAPEKRVIEEMRALGKPFTVILNTKYPENTDVKQLAAALEEDYGVPVLVKNVAAMKEGDFADVLLGVLMQFPVRRVDYDIPKWLCTLPRESEIMSSVLEKVKTSSACAVKMGDSACLTAAFEGDEYIKLAFGGAAEDAMAELRLWQDNSADVVVTRIKDYSYETVLSGTYTQNSDRTMTLTFGAQYGKNETQSFFLSDGAGSIKTYDTTTGARSNTTGTADGYTLGLGASFPLPCGTFRAAAYYGDVEVNDSMGEKYKNVNVVLGHEYPFSKRTFSYIGLAYKHAWAKADGEKFDEERTFTGMLGLVHKF